MIDEIKEIEEIINKLDNITPEEWNKREDETEEEFEERIQEIEEEIEDELIDVISDSLLNKQEINEEEAVREAREKIDKEYELYEDAFDKDDNGKLVLKDSEELAKLGYESKEEIEKLNAIMNNYNNPDQYIEGIRNSIKAKKDIDAEIERKVELAKTYISAKIRGEEPVIPSNEDKVKKYEDNNNYIITTRYLKRVPAVQNEYIYTNRIISQNYIPYVPSNNRVVTSGVEIATQKVSRPVVRPETTVSNLTKVKVLRNLETKMDKCNDLTKQKIQARTELKKVFKEFKDKDLSEDEVTDLQDKIAKIEKKYPNIVNEKTLSKLYKDFNVVVPEKEQEKEKDKTIKVEKTKKEKKVKTKVEKKKPTTKPVEKEDKRQLIDKAKKELTDKKQEVGKIQEDATKVKQNTENIVKNIKKIGEKLNRNSKTTKYSAKSILNHPNSDSIKKFLITEKSKTINVNDIGPFDLFVAVSYLKENDDNEFQRNFDNTIKEIDTYIGDDFANNVSGSNEYFDIKTINLLYELCSSGVKSKDGSREIIKKDLDKAKTYLGKELDYILYLKNKLNNKGNNPIENLKNEARLCNVLSGADILAITKKSNAIKLLLKTETIKRVYNKYKISSYENDLVKYKDKIKNGKRMTLAELEMLGDIFYNGIKSRDGDIILNPDIITAKNTYEKLIRDYGENKIDNAYNRLLSLYNDATLPTYDKVKAKNIQNIMMQKGIKLNNANNEAKEKNKLGKCSYVCSDIHGQYEVYKSIVDRIGEKDKLYILGDVIDRGGPDGIKIIQDIMKRQENGQVEFFMGNHEYVLLQTMLGKQMSDSYTKEETYKELEKLTSEEKTKIKDFLMDSLIYKQIKENDQNYYLVHARAIEDSKKESQTYREMSSGKESKKIFGALFDRARSYKDCNEEDVAKDGIFTIIGHTPTDNGCIELRKGYIDIDCGASYDDNAALVNLTTGDVEYFSVEKIKEKEKINKETDKGKEEK